MPDLEPRRVVAVEIAPRGFRVVLDDGQALRAQRVVVATGIAKFRWRPELSTGSPIINHQTVWTITP